MNEEILDNSLDEVMDLTNGMEEPVTTFLGLEWGDMPDFYSLLIRLAINFIMVGIIARCFYYPKSRRRDYLFIFIIMAMSIFMLVSLMEGSKMKTGAALGLFAIFGIIRYRTEAIPIREMTYLFMLVSTSVVNAMVVKMHWENILSLTCANLFFIFLAWMFESSKIISSKCSKYIKYDNVNLVAPDKRDELKADLEKRTGLTITQIEVGTIDFLKDSVLIRIFYDEPMDKNNSMESVARLPRNK
ncbi:MAG: DUF4956 domain-containing protein [Bacteroidales bacterium]|nr:DUF4956 domain-containing protein [Bacteroidales bacterium]